MFYPDRPPETYQGDRLLTDELFPNLKVRTYVKERDIGAIHELPLRYNEAFRAFLRKS